MTPEIHYDLNEELRNRETVEKIRVADDIEKARLLGDLSENGDYHAAKDDQGKNQSRINYLKEILADGNHRRDLKLEDPIFAAQPGESEEERNRRIRSTPPFETRYFNEEFGSTIANKDLRRISLPIRNLVCDHEDCQDHDHPIASHIDLMTSGDELPCMHCHRTHSTGAETAPPTEEGYVRCNPLRYGANTCAPVPSRIKESGFDPLKFLHWFSPDPTHKFPTLKRDEETGNGILFQQTDEEQDRNSPKGKYPGVQKVRTRKPGPGTLPNRGVESIRDFFTFGPRTGHAPWVNLGMIKRSIAEKDDPISSSDPRVIDRDSAEIIKPSVFRRLSATVEAGGAATALQRLLAGTDIHDWLHSATINNEHVKPEVARDDQGNIIHPDLTQDIWNEYLGYDPGDLQSPSDLISALKNIFRGNRKKYPVGFREGDKKGFVRKHASTDPDDINFDRDEAALEGISGVGFHGLTDDYDNTGDIGRDYEEPLPVEQLKIDCPLCHTFSTWNSTTPAFTSAHCPSPHCDGNCGSGMGLQAHCKGCGVDHPAEGCGGRPRQWYKGKDYVCPGCLNHGSIPVVREHCRDCGSDTCKGVTSFDSSHCDGCPEREHEKNGQPHDVTPGMHAKLPDILRTLGEGSVAQAPTFEQIFGTAPNTSQVIRRKIREEVVPSLEAEGIDPNIEDARVIEFARDFAQQMREKDIDEGNVMQLSPLEKFKKNLELVGPSIVLRDFSRMTPAVKDSPEIAKQLTQDVQTSIQEPPKFEPGGMGVGQTAFFDNAEAIARLEALRENIGSLDRADEGDEDDVIDLEPHVINNVVTPHIEHDKNCKKCNHGVIDPDVVGPEKMAELNAIFHAGVSRISRTVSDPGQRASQISQLLADTYKCEG